MRFLSIGYTMLLVAAPLLAQDQIAPGVTVAPGAVNGALFARNGEMVAVYGDPRPAPAKVKTVLLTHHRRDVAWAARALVRAGTQAVVPDAEKPLFTGVAEWWDKYRTARFHDYTGQSSRVLTEPLPVARTVRGGDRVEGFEVMETPGYTRGA